MARKLLPPEEATSWEDFHDRYQKEWSYRNNRPRSLGYVFHVFIGMLLLIVALVFLIDAAGSHGHWWQWLGVALPVVIVIWMLVRAWNRGSHDGERLKELERLNTEWQERVGRGEVPRTRAEAEGRTA